MATQNMDIGVSKSLYIKKRTFPFSVWIRYLSEMFMQLTEEAFLYLHMLDVNDSETPMCVVSEVALDVMRFRNKKCSRT
jgi:hypothetical protein